MSNEKITFIFTKGRSIRLNDNESAKEFLYSYNYFEKNFKNTELFEYQENDNESRFLKFLDKVLRKMTGLPFYTQERPNKSQKKIISESSYLIYTNHRHGLSYLPYFLFNKRDKNISVILMGLIKDNYGNKIQNYFATSLLKILFKVYDNLIFLSKGEFEKAASKFTKYKDKFNFLPFSIDTDFWITSQDNIKKNFVLFIGNDGNREYEKVVQLVNEMKDYSFILVTSKINREEIKNEKCQIINGNWLENKYTDSDIRKFYKQAKITILPLKESLQPSGQSVALQSMSMKVPVMITATEGFWDYSKFGDKENIFFVDNNDIKLWQTSIEDLFHDDDLLKKVSASAYETIQENYKLKEFYKGIKKILKIS